MSEIRTIADAARIQARDQGDAVVFSFNGRDMTYAALDQGSSRTANGLASLGVGKGDRIAYLGKIWPGLL